MLAKRSAHLNTIGPKIRELRLRKGWSQGILAAKLQIQGWDVPVSTVSLIERQRHGIADYQAWLLSAVLKVSLQELFEPAGENFLKH